MLYDVAIIGGSSAGLSAALTLGRLNKKTIVFDTGKPRNRFAAHSHNLFTRDGTPPLELLQIARQQLEQYNTVTINPTKIISAKKVDADFVLQNEAGAQFHAKRVILATGLTDILPDIPGVNELWGTKIVHCPFCHGWEAKDKSVALMNSGVMLEHVLPMISLLNTDITIVSNGPADISDEFRKLIADKNIPLYEAKILAVRDSAENVEISLENGQSVQAEAIYLKTTPQFNNGIAVELDCKLADDGSVAVSENFETSVPGVFAVGDLSNPMMQQVIFAAASGTRAAAFCIRSLMLAGE